METSPSQVALFESGHGGYNTYRIPALTVTAHGTLLAFCEGRKNSGSDSGDIDLLLRRSVDGGKTWKPVQVVVDDGADTCGNPCPLVDRNTGSVILLFTKNKGTDHQDAIMKGDAAPRTVWITRSADEGRTWSAPVDISAQARRPDWRWYATGPCHGVQLTSGRLVAPCDHSTGIADGQMMSHVIFSDDGGAKWQIGGSAEARSDESTVAELGAGELYLNMRNMRGTHRRATTRSSDQGLTWGPSVDDAGLPEPVCQASCLAIRTPDHKDAVLFSNPASLHRENLTVRLSFDACHTWPVAKSLWTGPAAYSDLAMALDGTIMCLFECGEKKPYETITLARFSYSWLAGNRYSR